MKKLILTSALVLFFAISMQSQVYSTALGLGIDSGNGATFVGPSVKHFFSENHAGQAEVTFETGVTAITALYQFHDEFDGANGLQWFAGGGATLFSGSGDSLFALRGSLGLDFKIPGAPIALAFDWRPALALDGDAGNTFEAGAFGFGGRYVFN
ncbi:hypothetical protein [Croceivirga thetidis]|uniref:Outer membrane insertion C-signal n=1 Tax=Croceivirga thetidis TaxID=2721623 RepID=A0ABX1GQM1_9FLAO|nr:hypothetical protein [Croceivirga thetidis]NKI31894.1 hypothetical protein [Croceivirga thetidis]